MKIRKNPLEIFNIATFLQTQILMLPVMLLFYQDNGLSAGDLFLFQGIFSITALFCEIPAGYLGDIFSRKKILILSFALFLGRLFLWYFFKGYWIVLAGEILYAMSKACFSGVSDGYIYEYLKSQQKTNKMLSGYGKLNFWMSVGTALASLTGPFLYVKIGISGLIILEMIFNVCAIALLLLLPNISNNHKRVLALKNQYKDLFRITKRTLTSPQLSPYIFYSGVVAATTMIFVWGFQPLMKISNIPVVYFGVVYFINHLCRAGSGILLPYTLKRIKLASLAKLTYVLFVISFAFAIIITRLQNPYVGMILLACICVAIGFQLTFTLGSVSRLHTLVSSKIRSTASSVNNLISRFLAGIMLIMFKFVLDGISLEISYMIYLVMFVFSIYPLFKLLRIKE